MQLTPRDMSRLHGVHRDLISVIEKAAELLPAATEMNGLMCHFSFFIIQGLRTAEEEAYAVATGKSDTKHSRHLHGFAVDFGALINGVLTWEEQYYHQIADALLKAAQTLNIPVVWGGSWVKPHDCDHIELDRHPYPDPLT